MAAPEGYNALGKIGISYKGDYDSNTTYERLDAVEHNGSTYLAIKDAPDGAPRDDKVNWIYLAKGFSGDIGDSEITFTEAENRENINTGESVKTVFGKIKKFFADLTAPAFAQMITTKEDLLATKATGYVPDAKAVADAYTELNGKLEWKRLGTRVGTNGIDIPKNANEICINVYLSDSEYPQYYKNIPIDLIGDTASTVLIDSTYYSSTDYTYITARISKTYVNLRLVWVNGKNVTATTNMVVSYR
jgi:hypothetical protein